MGNQWWKPFGNKSESTGSVGGASNVGTSSAVTEEKKTTTPQAVAPDSTKLGGLASTAPAAKADPLELVKQLSAGDVGYKTIDYLKPTSVTATTVEWRFGGGYEGRKMEAGTQVMLALPPEFQGRPVYMGVISHKQVQSDKTSQLDNKNGKPWDNTPGNSALHFHSTDHKANESWRYWNAPWGSSGKDGGKYAEVRGDWERETEFEFLKNGHSAVGGGYGARSKEALKIDAARLRSVGTDPVRVEKVVITFLPQYPDKTEEVIFSPGTKMGDPHTAAGRSYGKDTSKGTYPGALVMGGYGGGNAEAVAKLPAGWKMEGGNLTVELKPGVKFTGAEVSVGDTHPDGKSNSDGEIGKQGWSKLALGIQRGNGKIEWMARDMTIPPQGVLFGGPTLADYVAQPGDKLVINASEDTAYVMGVRLWYNEK